MYQKILIPLDLTDRHAQALRTAAELVGPGGEVTLLHVVEVIPGLSVEEERGFYARLERIARVHLQRQLTAFAERGIRCREEIVYGARAPEIARFALEQAAELIVLTAPQLAPDNLAASFGSLSYKVGLLSPCPVLLVK